MVTMPCFNPCHCNVKPHFFVCIRGTRVTLYEVSEVMFPIELGFCKFDQQFKLVCLFPFPIQVYKTVSKTCQNWHCMNQRWLCSHGWFGKSYIWHYWDENAENDSEISVIRLYKKWNVTWVSVSNEWWPHFNWSSLQQKSSSISSSLCIVQYHGNKNWFEFLRTLSAFFDSFFMDQTIMKEPERKSQILPFFFQNFQNQRIIRKL